ncbi:hypothetical protein [Sporosarcina sp. Marseille-Q4943]|uniref:hypothetical protein n=1 Tax=Sporosarcina sp. Marseille-Q4943 TaxID=2942204 RepID=UPI00208DAD10|nr:hypothetical protein [Sporosarcina sp. Marseille-Q4943]
MINERYDCTLGLERKAATPAGTARAEDPGLSAAKAVTKNGFCDQKRSVGSTCCLISAQNTVIRQIEPFAVRLAEAVPAESVRLKRKSGYLVNDPKVVSGHRV